MIHYTKESWVKYLHNQVAPSEREKMEIHMAHCDQCLETYLSSLEETDLVEMALPSPDFTNQVLGKINLPRTSPKLSLRAKRKIIFKYYAVAASITILLMLSGFFEAIEQIPNATAEIASTTGRVEQILTSGWSDRLMDSTIKMMNAIEIKRRSEDGNEN